jgi:hypothetical protein
VIPRRPARLTRSAVIGFVAIMFVAGCGSEMSPSASGSPGAASTSAVPVAGFATPAATIEVRPTPQPMPTLPDQSARFTSPWYGYSVAYPDGWTVTPGGGPWPPGDELRHLDPRLDQIVGAVGTAELGSHQARFVGASVELPRGMDLSGFMAFASSGACRPLDPLAHDPADPRDQQVVDGVEATVTLDGCASLAELGGTIWDLVLVTGGRGYDFTIDGWISADDAKGWLDTIVLDPSAARAAG